MTTDARENQDLEQVGWLMEWQSRNWETGEMEPRRELRFGSGIPGRGGTRTPVYRMAPMPEPGRMSWWRRIFHSCDTPRLCCPEDDGGRRFTCPECGTRWRAVVIEGTEPTLGGLLDCSTVAWRRLPHSGRHSELDAEADHG